MPLIVALAGNALELIFKLLHQDKAAATASALQPAADAAIRALSQAAGETEAETAARLARHEAAVATYAAGPPPGANLG